MAVIAAIVALFLAQIYAPPSLKPLTNRLLEYPGSLPAISVDRGILRTTLIGSLTRSPLASLVHNQITALLPKNAEIMCAADSGYCQQIKARQAKDGGYAGGGTGPNSNAVIGSDVEKAGQTAAIIASNQGASAQVIANAIAAAGLAVPADIQTQVNAQAIKPPTTTAQSAAYIAQYGSEIGRFGYVYPDGTVAGTYKAADGSLRVLAIGDTQAAYTKNVQTVTNQLSNLSQEDLLKSTGQTDLNSALSVYLTRNAIIDASTKASIMNNYKSAVAATQQANDALNQKVSDYINLTDAEIKAKYGTDNRYDLISSLPPDVKSQIQDQRNAKFFAEQKDLSLVQAYADPINTPYQLAEKVCNGSPDCIKYFSSFKREDYLQDLTNEQLVAVAKTNYQINLINLTQLKDTVSFSTLPISTQKAITKVNTDITHAFAAYSFDHNKKPGTIVSVDSSNKLALEFGKLLKDDPGTLDKWLASYNQNKDLYADLIKSTGLFNYLVTEKNPIIVAELKELTKNASIQGLSVKGKTLAWDQVAETYKAEARLFACQQDASLKTLCGAYLTPSAMGSQHKQLETNLLDAEIKKDGSIYLQQVFDKYTGADILLSTSFSNVATIYNPLVDAKLKQDALDSLYSSSGYGITQKKLDLSNLTETEIIKVNDYLDRQLVTETYKIGGGIAIGTAGFIGGMAVGAGVCAATIVGAAVSPVCAIVGGVVGGISSVLATQVPLYEMTSSEYAAQRGGDGLGASIFQSLYSNQGAYGDEGMGRSITTRDNQFALYSALNYAQGNQSLTAISESPELQTQMAVQGLVLNQWEENQNRQEQWTYASLPIAGLTGALNVSVGTSIASSFAGRTITSAGVGSYIRNRVTGDLIMFGGSTAINQLQTIVQFNTTGGDTSLLTTPEQVNYQVCVLNKGEDSCASEQLAMTNSVATNREFTLKQAFATDLLTQVIQSSVGYRSVAAEYAGIVSAAEANHIPTQGRTIGDIQADIQKLGSITQAVNPADAALLAENTKKIIAALPTTDKDTAATATIRILNADLDNLKNNKLAPIQNEDGKFRLVADPDAPKPLKESVQHFNNLAEDVELANGHPLTKEQATILATAPDIETGVKSVTPGGGKTSYIVLIEHAKKNKSIYSGANRTDTLDAINTVLKTKEGREYAQKRLGEVFYVEEDGTVYKVNLEEGSFDPNTICKAGQSRFIPIARAACSNASGTQITATEFDSILADPSRSVSIYGTHNGMGWEGQKGSWGQKILDGQYNTNSQGFHIIADEAAKDALGSLAISGDPELITKSKLGQNTIKTLDELMDLPSLKSLVADQLDPSKPNLIAKVKNQDNYALGDAAQKTQILRDIAKSALDQIEAEQKSILNILKPKPNATDLADLRTLIANMNEGDFDTFLKRPGNSVIDAVSSRYTLMTDIINQLGLTENDFGLSADRKSILLFEAKGETGKTYSSIGQQLVLYEIGKQMLQARGLDISSLAPSSDLTVSVTKSQMTLNEWYQKNYRAGNSIAFLDGTPDPLVHLGLGGMQGEVVKFPIDSAFKQVNNYNDETGFVAKFSDNVNAESNKMHLLVLSDTQLGFDQVTNKVRSDHGNREVMVAQYNQGGEEFIHFEKGSSGKKTVYKTKAEWESVLHELANNKSGDALVIIQGRDRALDISVETDFLNMRWHSDLPRESIGTTSIQDSATQNVFRDRVFVERTRESLIQKLVDSGTPRDVATAQVEASKQYHVYTHDSLGVKVDVRAELPRVLAAQHAEHLNSLRLQATLTMLGDSQKNAISILASHGSDLGIADNKTFKSFIETNQAEGQRIQEVYKREITNKPLTNANEIALEIYTRGQREDARLRALLSEAESKLKLSSDQVNQLKIQWGIDQDYPSLDTYLASLNAQTTSITPRNFKTDSQMFSPATEVMYWAGNSSTNDSSPAQYRVPTEAFIQSTVPKSTKSAPFTATSTTPRSPIFTQLSNSLQSLNAGLHSLSLAAFTPNTISTPTQTPQLTLPPRLITMITAPNFKSLVVQDDQENGITIIKDQSGELMLTYEEDGDITPPRIFDQNTDFSLLPPSDNISSIILNGQTQTTNQDLVAPQNIELTTAVHDPDFSNLTIILENGDKIVIYLLSGNLTYIRSNPDTGTTPTNTTISDAELIKLIQGLSGISSISYNDFELTPTALTHLTPASPTNPITTLVNSATNMGESLAINATKILSQNANNLTLQEKIKEKKYQVPLSINPSKPFRSNDINQELSIEWINSQSNPELKLAAQTVVDNITHISQEDFEKALSESIDDFNSRGDDSYITMAWEGKSNKWVLEQSLPNLKNLPEAIISGSIYGGSWDPNPQNIKKEEDNSIFQLISYLKLHPNVKRVALFDDSAYSATQLNIIIDELAKSGLNDITIDIVVPFMTTYGQNKLLQNGNHVRIMNHKTIPTVAELIPDPEIQKYILKINEFSYITTEEEMGDLTTRALIYFDHKVPDNVSSLGFLNLSFIENVVSPYNSSEFNLAYYSYLVDSNQAQVIDINNNLGLNPDQRLNVTIYNYRGSYILSRGTYPIPIFLIRNGERRQILRNEFITLEENDKIEQPEYAQFEAPNKPAISIEFSDQQFKLTNTPTIQDQSPTPALSTQLSLAVSNLIHNSNPIQPTTPLTFTDNRSTLQKIMDWITGQTMNIVNSPNGIPGLISEPAHEPAQSTLSDPMLSAGLQAGQAVKSLLPSPEQPTKTHIQAFKDFTEKWESRETKEIWPLQNTVDTAKANQEILEKRLSALNRVKDLMVEFLDGDFNSMATIRRELKLLGTTNSTPPDIGEQEGNRVVLKKNAQYYKDAELWLDSQIMLIKQDLVVGHDQKILDKNEPLLTKILKEKEEETQQLEVKYGDSIKNLASVFNDMKTRTPIAVTSENMDINAWRKANADKTFTLSRVYVVDSTTSQLPLDQVSDLHGFSFRNKNLTLDEVEFLSNWIKKQSGSIDWASIASQHVNEGFEKQRNYVYFDPLISASSKGVSSNYGNSEMTLKIKGDKLIPWTIIASQQLAKIQNELNNIGLTDTDRRYWEDQKRFWGGSNGSSHEDEYLIIGEITLDELVADTTHPNLNEDKQAAKSKDIATLPITKSAEQAALDQFLGRTNNFNAIPDPAEIIRNFGQMFRNIGSKLGFTQNYLLFQVQLRQAREDKIYSLSPEIKSILRRAIANGNTDVTNLYYITSTLRYPALANLKDELINTHIPQWLNLGSSDIRNLLQTVHIINETHPELTQIFLDRYIPEWIAAGIPSSDIYDIAAEISRLSPDSIPHIAKEIPYWYQLPGQQTDSHLSLYEINQLIRGLSASPETIQYIAPYIKYYRPQRSGGDYFDLIGTLQGSFDILLEIHIYLPTWLGNNNSLYTIKDYIIKIQNDPSNLAFAPYFNTPNFIFNNRVSNQALLTHPELMSEIISHFPEWSKINTKYKSIDTVTTIIYALQAATPDRRAQYYQDLQAIIPALTNDKNDQYTNEYQNIGQLLGYLNSLSDTEYQAINPYLSTWIDHGFITYDYDRFNLLVKSFLVISPNNRSQASDIIIEFLGNSKYSDPVTISYLLNNLYENPSSINNLLSLLKEMGTSPHYTMDFPKLVSVLNNNPSLIAKLSPYITSWYGQRIYDTAIFSFIELMQKFPELPIEEVAPLAIKQAQRGDVDHMSIISDPSIQALMTPKYRQFIQTYIKHTPIRFKLRGKDGFEYYKRRLFPVLEETNELYGRVLQNAYDNNENIKDAYEEMIASDVITLVEETVFFHLSSDAYRFWNLYTISKYFRSLPDPVNFFETKLKPIARDNNQVLAAFYSDALSRNNVNSAWELLGGTTIDDDILALLPEKEALFWKLYRKYPFARERLSAADGLAFATNIHNVSDSDDKDSFIAMMMKNAISNKQFESIINYNEHINLNVVQIIGKDNYERYINYLLHEMQTIPEKHTSIHNPPELSIFSKLSPSTWFMFETLEDIYQLIEFKKSFITKSQPLNNHNVVLQKIIDSISLGKENDNNTKGDDLGLKIAELTSWLYSGTIEPRLLTPISLMGWRVYTQIYGNRSIDTTSDFIDLLTRIGDSVDQQLRDLNDDSIQLPLNYRVSIGTEIEVINNGLNRTGIFNLDDYIKLKKLINQRKSTGSSSLSYIDEQINELKISITESLQGAINAYKNQVVDLNLLGVGEGADGTHEFANKPVPEYSILIWELSELEKLGFLSLHPQILQWIGERGIHITISGETGIRNDENANLLQNTLLATGYATSPINGQGGIQDAEEKSETTVGVGGNAINTTYNIARGLFIRTRDSIVDIFRGYNVPGVEFRVNSISSIVNLNKTLKAYNRLSIPLMVFQRNIYNFDVNKLMETMAEFIDDPTLMETILDDNSNDFLLPEIHDPSAPNTNAISPLDRKLILIWAYYRTQSIYGFEKYQKSGILPSPLNPPTSKQLIVLDGELGQVFKTTEEGSSRLLDDAFSSFHETPSVNTLPWFMQNLVDETIQAVESTFTNVPASKPTISSRLIKSVMEKTNQTLTSLGAAAGEAVVDAVANGNDETQNGANQPLLPMLVPAGLGGGTTIGTIIINTVYNAAVAATAAIEPYVGPVLPLLNNYLMLNAQGWIYGLKDLMSFLPNPNTIITNARQAAFGLATFFNTFLPSFGSPIIDSFVPQPNQVRQIIAPSSTTSVLTTFLNNVNGNSLSEPSDDRIIREQAESLKLAKSLETLEISDTLPASALLDPIGLIKDSELYRLKWLSGNRTLWNIYSQVRGSFYGVIGTQGGQLYTRTQAILKLLDNVSGFDQYGQVSAVRASNEELFKVTEADGQQYDLARYAVLFSTRLTALYQNLGLYASLHVSQESGDTLTLFEHIERDNVLNGKSLAADRSAAIFQYLIKNNPQELRQMALGNTTIPSYATELVNNPSFWQVVFSLTEDELKKTTYHEFESTTAPPESTTSLNQALNYTVSATYPSYTTTANPHNHPALLYLLDRFSESGGEDLKNPAIINKLVNDITSFSQWLQHDQKETEQKNSKLPAGSKISPFISQVLNPILIGDSDSKDRILADLFNSLTSGNQHQLSNAFDFYINLSSLALRYPEDTAYTSDSFQVTKQHIDRLQNVLNVPPAIFELLRKYLVDGSHAQKIAFAPLWEKFIQTEVNLKISDQGELTAKQRLEQYRVNAENMSVSQPILSSFAINLMAKTMNHKVALRLDASGLGQANGVKVLEFINGDLLLRQIVDKVNELIQPHCKDCYIIRGNNNGDEYLIMSPDENFDSGAFEQLLIDEGILTTDHDNYYFTLGEWLYTNDNGETVMETARAKVVYEPFGSEYTADRLHDLPSISDEQWNKFVSQRYPIDEVLEQLKQDKNYDVTTTRSLLVIMFSDHLFDQVIEQDKFAQNSGNPKIITTRSATTYQQMMHNLKPGEVLIFRRGLELNMAFADKNGAVNTLFLDVPGTFKQINDTYGYLEGDKFAGHIISIVLNELKDKNRLMSQVEIAQIETNIHLAIDGSEYIVPTQIKNGHTFTIFAATATHHASSASRWVNLHMDALRSRAADNFFASLKHLIADLGKSSSLNEFLYEYFALSKRGYDRLLKLTRNNAIAKLIYTDKDTQDLFLQNIYEQFDLYSPGFSATALLAQHKAMAMSQNRPRFYAQVEGTLPGNNQASDMFYIIPTGDIHYAEEDKATFMDALSPGSRLKIRLGLVNEDSDLEYEKMPNGTWRQVDKSKSTVHFPTLLELVTKAMVFAPDTGSGMAYFNTIASDIPKRFIGVLAAARIINNNLNPDAALGLAEAYGFLDELMQNVRNYLDNQDLTLNDLACPVTIGCNTLSIFHEKAKEISASIDGSGYFFLTYDELTKLKENNPGTTYIVGGTDAFMGWAKNDSGFETFPKSEADIRSLTQTAIWMQKIFDKVQVPDQIRDQDKDNIYRVPYLGHRQALIDQVRLIVDELLKLENERKKDGKKILFVLACTELPDAFKMAAKYDPVVAAYMNRGDLSPLDPATLVSAALQNSLGANLAKAAELVKRFAAAKEKQVAPNQPDFTFDKK